MTDKLCVHDTVLINLILAIGALSLVAIVTPISITGTPSPTSETPDLIIDWSNGATPQSIAATVGDDPATLQALEALAAQEQSGVDTSFPGTDGFSHEQAAAFISDTVASAEGGPIMSMAATYPNPQNLPIAGYSIDRGYAWRVNAYQYQSDCTRPGCPITDRRLERLTVTPQVGATRVELSLRLCEIGDCAGMGFIAWDFGVWRSGSSDGAQTLNGSREHTFNSSYKRQTFISHRYSHEGRCSVLAWDADWSNSLNGQIVDVKDARTGWARTTDDMTDYNWC